jgi:hypothetical protein
MRARPNKGRPDFDAEDLDVDDAVELDFDELRRGVEASRKWTWHLGKRVEMPRLKVLHIPDPDLGDMEIVACGELIRLHLRSPKKNPGHPRRERDTMVELSRRASANSYLGYQMGHPYDRLHIILDPSVQEACRHRFWVRNDSPRIEMNRLASLAGGRHGKLQDYPDLEVKPVGILTAVVYRTEKEGDATPGVADKKSYYIHKMAELSHYYPILACDDLGRLWILGGNYTAPTPGITD